MPVSVGHFLKSIRNRCMHKKERLRAVQDRKKNKIKNQKLTAKSCRKILLY